MGQEAEADVRRKVFASYQVDAALMAAAKPGAIGPRRMTRSL